jgi:hypothetical protein
MSKNDAAKTHCCEVCKYATNRKYDLKRHQNAVHHTTPTRANFRIFKEENVAPNEENVAPNEENVAPNGENVAPSNICKKCNKIYKNKKYLVSHEAKCKGIDELTCPRCMVSFTTRQHKYRHITNNKCKPRSIIHARTPNADNITNNINSQNIENQNNINTLNNTQNNNIIINNYGSERMDYLDFDKMLDIFKTAYNIPSILTKHIHFNKDFPENNNITCSNDDKNYSLVKMNDEYIFKNLNSLVYELIKDKTRLMHNFATGNKENICVSMDTRIYEDIIELLLKLLLLQEPSEQYKHQVGIIRDMIKNSNVLCKVD